MILNIIRLQCFLFFYFQLIESISSYSSFFNYWTCIGIREKISFNKPYSINIGELPLVLWKDNENKIISSLNICKHMGSKLNNGIITEKGCLKCRYHGLEYTNLDKFGEIIEQDGKIFWAYKPIEKTPHKIPFFNNPHYEKSFNNRHGSILDRFCI